VIKGHVVKDCWYRGSNRDKRLAEFKIKSDRRNSEEAAGIKHCNNNNIQEYFLGRVDQETIYCDPNL
jgi:hypothetical protein